MADIKWIKIATSIFDNRKIHMIESMKKGDTLIVIWLKLLTLAGKINDEGLIYFTTDIPYTDEMLASLLNRPLKTIQNALEIFEKFSMIERKNEMICILNWEKYQNIEGLEKVREQTKQRVYRFREKQKEKCNATCNVTVTERNATDKEEDKDKEKEEDIEIKKKSVKEKAPKHKFGAYEHVLLTDEEFNKLAVDFGQEVRDKAITFLDSYIEEKGYKAKSHNLSIRRWVIDAVTEHEGKRKQGNRGVSQINDTEDAIKAFLSGREN